jgi:hypothetical protein
MNLKRAVLAGVVATAAATGLWLLEPMIGLPRLAVGSMLSSFLAVATAYLPAGPAVGWTIHGLVGVGLALLYAGAFIGRLPGRPLARGLAYGCAIFLLAQLTFMPLVGGGIFSRGDVPLLVGSFIGHIVYGSLLALLYGDPGRPA